MTIVLDNDADFSSSLDTHTAITFDLTPPDPPVITYPADTGGVTDATPVIEGSAEADALILVTLDDGVDKATYQVTADGSGNWSLDTDPEVTEPIGVDNGFGFNLGETATVSATATDEAGHVSEVSTITFDVFDVLEVTEGIPVITLPDDGDIINSATPEIQGLAEPGSIIYVTISDNNGEAAIYKVPDSDGDGEWALDINTHPPSGFTPGFSIDHEETVTIEASATGSSGETKYADPVVVSVDTAIPSRPSIDTPSDNAFTQDDPLLSGTAEPLSTVTVVLSDDSGAETYVTTASATGEWQIDLETTPPTAGDITLSHGEKINMSATATDDAGNESPADVLAFTIDMVAPDEPVILSPSNGGGVTDTTPVIAGSAEAGSTITLTLSDDNSSETYHGITVNEDGNWTLDLDSGTALTGDVDVSASATDEAGNQSGQADSAFSIVTVENSVPEIITPANGSSINDATPVIAGAADPNAIVNLTLSDGTFSGIYRTTADDQGNWKIDLDTDKTISGGIVLDNDETITATASAEDQDRNVSDNSALSFFTIDTVPPGSVQITSPADNSTIVDPDTIHDSDFEISGTADAETEIRVTLVESDTNERVTYIITSDAIGGWKINLGGEDEPDFGLDEGEGFEIYATAYDLAGNESPTASSNFQYLHP